VERAQVEPNFSAASATAALQRAFHCCPNISFHVLPCGKLSASPFLKHLPRGGPHSQGSSEHLKPFRRYAFKTEAALTVKF
jgi:hypothetical protein